MTRWFTQVRLRFRSIVYRRTNEQELDEELQDHLDRQIDAELAQGFFPEQARYAALRALGSIAQSKEECRDMRGVNWLENLRGDLSYGVRTLRRNPAFSIVALLALALGIGANTAMFSVAYGMLWRPLPFANADGVAVVHMNHASREFQYGTLCIRDYLIWKEENRAFEEPALFSSERMDIGGSEGIPEQVTGARVTATFFATLGVRPLTGRTFVDGEDKPTAPALAVLNESLWLRRYGGDSGVIGRTILLNGASATVVGVVPHSVRFPRRDTEVWTNLPLIPPTRYGPWLYRVVARLKPGVTLQQAQAQTSHIGRRMEERNPYYKNVKLPVLGLRDALLGASLRAALLVLSGAVGLVLLIAVVNVANLMLVRATVREREMALRLSLGAGPGRLVRQLLTESVLLAVAGGLVGLALAWGGIQVIRAWNPANLPLIDSVRLDWGALGFMALVSTLAGILFGLAPALESARADLNSTMKDGGRSASASGSRGRIRKALVICEIAITLTVLVGAGLLFRSFLNMQRVTYGMNTPPEQLLTMRISPGDRKYDDATVGLAYYDEVLRRSRSLPGVEIAAITDSLPPDRQGDADTFEIEGHPLPPGEMNPVVSRSLVGPDFFRALGIPLRKGRYFTEHDKPQSKPVAIVSEAFVRRFLPNEEPIGKHLKYGSTWMEIVGVVGNVRYLGLTADTDPAYYMPFGQDYFPRMFLAIRTSKDNRYLADALRREIQAINRGATLAQISTMEQALDFSVAQPRFHAMLLALFAAIALSLAAVGIYGLIAYTVAQRTQEFGLRIALGAARADVLRLVAYQGVWLAVIGNVLGIAGAFVLSRLLKTMLFGVAVTDAITFAAAPLGLLLVVLLATIVPALRATRISPIVALRYE